MLTAGVVIYGVYVSLRAPSLLDYEALVVAALYITFPFCWLMPLTMRRAHLALWLVPNLAKWTEGPFTLWGEGLIMSDLTIAGWVFTALLDAVILLNGILAIRARTKDWQFLKRRHVLSVVVAPTVGTTIALLLWSTQISREIALQVQSLSHEVPYCLAVNGQAIKNFDDASGLQLVRNTYFIGPGAGFSFPTLSQFHAVLAVQDDKKVRYWYWSFEKDGSCR